MESPSAANPPSATLPTNPPCATVYVHNLEERIKIDQLKEALQEIFSEYGNIVDIVAKRNIRARGQAFVVFEDPASAAKAIEDIQGFDLFDKPMALDYARTPSDATVKKSQSEEAFAAHRQARIEERDRRRAQQEREALAHKKLKPPGEAGAGPKGSKPTKLGGGLKSTTGAGGSTAIPDEYLPPNKTLFLRDVPEGYDVDDLSAIFSRFDGFREVRLVPGRAGIAFVEYEAESGAIAAKERTSGMPLGSEQRPMRVTFQRQ